MRSRKPLLLAGIISLQIVAIFWVVSALTTRSTSSSQPPAPSQIGSVLRTETAPKTAQERRAEREIFFAQKIEPVISATDRRNREAANQCTSVLRESFESYRRGIPTFCEEINSWGTRLGVMKRMPTDWWYEKTDVNQFIRDKFSRHLFNDETLTNDVNAALDHFQEAVQSNQEQMLREIRVAVSGADLPNPPELDTAEFVVELSQRFHDFNVDSAEKSLVKGITIKVASAVGTAAAEMLLAQLVTELASISATATAGAGGATAGGAAVGGGGGATLGGPVGVVTGIAVGMIVGGIVDWWISSDFKDQMTQQLNQMIDDLSDIAIAGTASKPGLRDALRGSCDLMLTSYRETLRASIVDEPKELNTITD